MEDKEKKDKYEICLLVDQYTSEEETLLSFEKCINKLKCEYEILNKEYLFTQHLKYRINHLIRGSYILIKIEMEKNSVARLKRELELNKTIVRFVILNLKTNEKVLAAYDYKNFESLRKHMGDSGRILPSSITNLQKKEQKKLSKAIKVARFMGLVEYINRN